MEFGTGQHALAAPDEHAINAYTTITKFSTKQRKSTFSGFSKEQRALRAAEKHVINAYTSLTRATTNQWGWDFEDLAKLRYKEMLGQKGGFLIVSIKRSRIVEHIIVPEEQWVIEVVPDVGIELEAEEYIVYQEQSGAWIVTLWK